jgi:hypothetical protein
MMLDLVGAVVGLTAVAINLVAVVSVLPLSLAQRLILAGVLGAWVGLASGLGAAGQLAFSPSTPVPLVGVMAAAPLIVTTLLAMTNPKFRAALLAIPVPMLIGLNALRMLGVLFLLLAAIGRLSGPFPYFAGLGDIITGLFAIPLAFAVARGTASRTRIMAWTLFGGLDLFVAVGLGVTSANGSPIQLIHAGVGSEAMQYLPYCLVPTVLVPFYLVTLGIVAARVLHQRSMAVAA